MLISLPSDTLFPLLPLSPFHSLTAHLTSLTSRLQHLTAVIEDPDVSPGERLLALRDVAEEARGYKMGGEDKIRVAVTTAETVSTKWRLEVDLKQSGIDSHTDSRSDGRGL